MEKRSISSSVYQAPDRKVGGQGGEDNGLRVRSLGCFQPHRSLPHLSSLRLPVHGETWIKPPARARLEDCGDGVCAQLRGSATLSSLLSSPPFSLLLILASPPCLFWHLHNPSVCACACVLVCVLGRWGGIWVRNKSQPLKKY